jgi:transcriptional antiterminator RfaH
MLPRRAGDAMSSTDSQELRWYLIHCKPREDERALENLERQGFECYRPAQLVERRRNGRRCAVPEPLFPNYLFIRLDRVNDNWYPIRSTRGVIHIVRFNEFPLPVADAIIEGIRSRLAAVSVEPYLKSGDRVRIAEGPFSQLEAIFVANDGQNRVVLLLNILNRNQELSFPGEAVRKLG